MRVPVYLIAALLVMLPLATAHKFNHEDRHEVCDIYGGPHGHSATDGHEHLHAGAAAAALPDHDPCKQVRMAYPGYENNAPLVEVSPPRQEIPLEQLLFSDGDPSDTEVFVGGEAYQFPVPEGTFRAQSGLAILSDLQAAGMDLPGDGSKEDPFVIENFLISGNLLLKDTSKCYVVRNNVVVSRAAVAPLIPDPHNIIHLPDLNGHFEDLKAAAEAWRAQVESLLAQWDLDKAAWDADEAVWASQRASHDDQAAAYAAEAQAWEDEFAAFEADYLAAVRQTELLADDFEWYAGQYGAAGQPTRGHAAFISNGHATAMDGLQDAFEAYQQDQDGDLSAEDVEGWIVGNPPPATPPPGFWGDQADWDFERQNYAAYEQDILAHIQAYWDDLMAGAPDEAAYQAFLDERAAFQAAEAAFATEHAGFLEDLAQFRAAYDAVAAEHERVMGLTGIDLAAAEGHAAKVAQFDFEYVGQLGSKLYNTATELVQWVLKLLFGILDILDLNNVAQNTGQLILDWNGQCIHAYNNVVHDLRVNQNNDRTGYATGGILEDNRFFTIGQIRHYDGIFRENEVGNRAHLATLLRPGVVPAVASTRSVNNDGANQGWYFDNVFYGQIDLDFHGHHHSAGFFAPTSHYHGSSVRIVEMYDANGVCTTRWSDVDMTRHNGPDADHPQDSSIQLLGQTVTPGQDRSTECLDHMDHSKRWTSVFFNDNVVIDPNGVGLRFEDRDHRQDDEQANSENVRELKAPHFHQKWVQMEDNAVVGKIFIDVLNAAGTNLWSDTWAPVASPAGPARTVEALAHPGAEIVNSHPYRNDAWVDIQRNSVFLTQPTGIVVSDADDLELLQLKGNKGYGLRSGLAPGMSAPSFIEWLKASRGRTPDDVQADLTAWGGTDRGVQQLATLANLRDGFTVEHCANAARGLDKSIVARDRIYDDGASIVRNCGANDWGTAATVDLLYTPAPAAPASCTKGLREWTGPNDDFYSLELAFDAVDGATTATCPLPATVPAPTPESVVTTAKTTLGL